MENCLPLLNTHLPLSFCIFCFLSGLPGISVCLLGKAV